MSFDVTQINEQRLRTYFGLKEAVDTERCSYIISKSGVDLGDSDLYFEWLTTPTMIAEGL
jgi:hypothetical protein